MATQKGKVSSKSSQIIFHVELTYTSWALTAAWDAVRPGGAHPSPLQLHPLAVAKPVRRWCRGRAGGSRTLETGTIQSAQLIRQKAREKGTCSYWCYCNISIGFNFFKRVTHWGHALNIQTQKAESFPEEEQPQISDVQLRLQLRGCCIIWLYWLGSTQFSLQTSRRFRII